MDFELVIKMNEEEFHQDQGQGFFYLNCKLKNSTKSYIVAIILAYNAIKIFNQKLNFFFIKFKVIWFICNLNLC